MKNQPISSRSVFDGISSSGNLLNVESALLLLPNTEHACNVYDNGARDELYWSRERMYDTYSNDHCLFPSTIEGINHIWALKPMFDDLERDQGRWEKMEAGHRKREGTRGNSVKNEVGRTLSLTSREEMIPSCIHLNYTFRSEHLRNPKLTVSKKKIIRAVSKIVWLLCARPHWKSNLTNYLGIISFVVLISYK